MHSWVELNRQALLDNYDFLTAHSQPAALVPVVKSNAYGHGLAEVFEILCRREPKWLAVAYLDEAFSLRKLGYNNRILLVSPVEAHKGTIETLARSNIEIFLANESLTNVWLSTKHKPQAHVKIDTGLSRQGFLPNHIETLLTQVKPYFNEKIVGLCSHFANVEDVLDQEFALEQLSRLKTAREKFQFSGFKGFSHIASSASCLILEPSHLDLCRVGISLYGFWPSSSTRLSFSKIYDYVADLKPVLSWKTRIVDIKPIEAGNYVGYGCSFKAVQPMKLALLPIGYNDGYPRLAGNGRAFVLIKAKRCSIIGRISMNLMVVDISHLNNVEIGDPVTLVGSDGDEQVSAEDIAQAAETIHYEVVSQIHPAIERVIV